ncbi:RHS domain-containing protein [Enterobacter hormaechei]|nr:RHS repeat-associated core domain protein [Enterobacter hormaechei subsp. hoffmannii]EKU3267250.1 RHS domain-containing protein [Enterobacter hormaechei]EKU3272348.1 RHS domain-containing protein [Enterobacter hormaechei]EMB0671542.1 RHS domain-containing protein [Enterobacter hormaechei]HED3790300.1 RHS domain-containing protein [Enterobacter hormaechei subsp. hoffmannii]
MFHANRHFRDPSGQITRIRRTPTAEGVALGIESDEIAYRHDAAGRVLSESGINGEVGYEWDAMSNLTGLTLPGEQKLAWLHYGSGHVSAIRFGQQLVTEFTRDRLHREVRRTQGAREQLRQYDSLGRRTLQRSELSTDVTLPEQALLERLYRYTARGELSGVSDTLRGEVDYGYDAEGRLLKHYEARQGHSRAQFSYDAADNLAASDAVVPVTDNRLQHWQALFMKYDYWGNLVSRRNGLYEQHYAYDAENRLVSARGTGPEGRFEACYHYDALGRRTRKIVTTTHGTTDTRFLWQGYRLLQEQQESGLCSTYVYDPNEAWSPLARVDHLRDQSSGEIYWFNTDLNGAPLEVTDERGAVRWSGQYGSFGEVRHQSEGFSRLVNRTAMAHQPLRYAGQYADGETGLHYNLFRYYDPQVGRFIVQDPIGLNGGWNLYQYAPNPLGWIDPLGLSCTGTNRRQALNKAKDTAGIPRSQQPERQWIVGSDKRRRGSTNYQYSEDLGSHGRYYEYTDAQGHKKVVVEHTADPRAPGPHTHAGKSKPGADPRTYDFKESRYQKINVPSTNDHHIYYD